MDDTPDPWIEVRRLAAAQADVIGLRQLYAAGLTRWQVRAQVKARRWQRLGDQSVCLHNGPVTDEQHRWAAVFQGGPRAKLDGTAALVAGGLERFTITRIRVSVPRGAQARRTPRYEVRQTRRWDDADREPSGIPRAKMAPAAVRAALWGRPRVSARHVIRIVAQAPHI